MNAKPNMSVPDRGEAPTRADDTHPLRAISFGNPAVTIDRRDDGTLYLRPKIALGDYPVRITARLHHWATMDPTRVLMPERRGGGGRTTTYPPLPSPPPPPTANRL